MKIRLIIISAAVVLLLANISAHKSMWPNSNKLTNQNKVLCVQFQYLQGSNRLAEFNEITKIGFNKVGTSCYISSKWKKFDIEKILGKPDLVCDECYFYYLNPSHPNNKAVITFDKNVVNCMVTQ